MALSYNKFNVFSADLAAKKHNLGTDQITVALSNSAPVATNTVLANLTEISYTNCSTRNLTTSSSGQTSGTYSLVLADLTLTASGGSVGPFRYVVFYNSTASGGPLICWFDLASSITLASGQSMTLDLDNANGLFQVS